MTHSLSTELNQSPSTHKETHKIGKFIVLFIIYLQEASKLKLPRIPIKFLAQVFNQLYMYAVLLLLLYQILCCGISILCVEIEALVPNYK